jgi:hypothetical protein
LVLSHRVERTVGRDTGTAVLGFLRVHTRERGDTVTGSEPEPEMDPVQESDEESFPASDPPSSWTGGDPEPGES